MYGFEEEKYEINFLWKGKKERLCLNTWRTHFDAPPLFLNLDIGCCTWWGFGHGCKFGIQATFYLLEKIIDVGNAAVVAIYRRVYLEEDTNP